MKKLLLSGVACCSLLTADFSALAWRYRRSLTVSPRTAVSEFTVDATLYRNSAANLDDLRILRDSTETPYVLLTLSGSRQTIEPAATIINKVWVPGTGLQAVLDMKGHPEHNRLRIITALHNFKENVRVETSDDAHSWAVAQSAGLIFDVLRDDHRASETTVSYPLSTRRFVRLTIAGWTEPKNLRSVWLCAFKETGATRDVVATLSPSIHEDAKAQTTELTLDVGFPGQPFDRIDLSVDPGLFCRTVEIVGTNDLQHWYSTAGGVISRTADGEQLTLETPERTERYLRIIVSNADSAPLHYGIVTLRGVRRVVKFPSAEPGAYFVYTGNPSARQASYDFVRILPTSGLAASAILGAAEANPKFRLPERPWTDRNPWLLNGTLFAAVVAMGVVTLRMLKKVS